MHRGNPLTGIVRLIALPALAVAGAVLAMPALLASSRSDLPPPEPGRGSIGITVDYEARLIHNHEPAIEVYFVPVQEDADRLAGETFVTSNLNRERQHQCYLLNAKPGRYVAVAALMPSADHRHKPYRAFFAAEMIPLTEVTVPAGGLAFAGEHLVTLTPRFGEADKAQAHYFPMIAPQAAAQTSTALRIFSGEAPQRALPKASHRDPADEKKFWDTARTHVFQERKDWLDLIDRRLQDLAASPAPVQN